MKFIRGTVYLEESDDNRLSIMMNEKFMVAVILTKEGFIFDVYDADGEELFDTTTIWFDGDGKFTDNDKDNNEYDEEKMRYG